MLKFVFGHDWFICGTQTYQHCKQSPIEAFLGTCESGISLSKHCVNGQAEEFYLCIESGAWRIYFLYLFYYLNWEQQNHNLEITAVDSSPPLQPRLVISYFSPRARLVVLIRHKEFYSQKLASILVLLLFTALFKTLLLFFCTYFYLQLWPSRWCMGENRAEQWTDNDISSWTAAAGGIPGCVWFFFLSNRVSAFLQPVSCHNTYLPGERNCTWNIFQKPNHGRARGRLGTIKKERQLGKKKIRETEGEGKDTNTRHKQLRRKLHYGTAREAGKLYVCNFYIPGWLWQPCFN